MGKNVYSIVLQEEVVRAVDAAAFRQGISRSALMNRLLAEAVGFVTPEEQMREAFGALRRVLEPLPEFQMLSAGGDAMCRLTSALRYKYNPVVKYAVVLYRDKEGVRGEMKTSLRSQSAGLLQSLHEFFGTWKDLEDETLKNRYFGGTPCKIQPGRYQRAFSFPPRAMGLSNQELGECLAAYIRVFDGAMKQYFNCDGSAGDGRRAMTEYYAAAAPKLFENYAF